VSNITEIVSGIFLVIGAVAMLVGGVGILRMPDLFTRLHAVGIIDTLGVAAILIGLATMAGWGLVLIKLLIIFALLMLLNPSASHALARAAVHGAKKPWLTASK
jgi:multicomponent Na+:H+ antiporter subunit G